MNDKLVQKERRPCLWSLTIHKKEGRKQNVRDKGLLHAPDPIAKGQCSED